MAESFYRKRVFLLTLEILEALERREFEKVTMLKEQRALYSKGYRKSLREQAIIFVKKQQEEIIADILRKPS